MQKSVEENITDELTILGATIRKKLDRDKIFAINVMASPGAGKTSVIGATIKRLMSKVRIGVIEGDIVPIDVDKLQKTGVSVVLAHTGGSCHLDSVMMKTALRKLQKTPLDLLIVENVGNLICPANFYLGTHQNVVIASVPEGSDKPYKYPNMFRGADVVILNKIDYLAFGDFDMDEFTKGVKHVAPHAKILPLSAKTGEGIDAWERWVYDSFVSYRSHLTD